MKKQKFDFFSSPNPRAFDINKIQQNQHHLEPDQYQILFNTPAVHHTFHSPINIQPFFSCQQKHKNRKNSEDCIFEENHVDLQEESSHGIHEKLDFSDEQDLMIEITPMKDEKMVDQLQDQTIKKEEKIHYNMSGEGTINEVGLKNLALEAFKYISSLTKASYKEVAYALISKLNRSQHQGSGKNALKRKESNIKRRVYDALNVFIAIGLLQKNGKKLRSYPFFRKHTVNNLPKNTSQELEIELVRLKTRYSKKMDIITRKQEIYNLHLQGLNKMKYLQNRNKEMENRILTKIIYFPFLLLCKYQSQNPIKQQPNPENVMIIVQQNEQTLKSTFQFKKSIDIIGDFDIISRLPLQETLQDEHPVAAKSQKRRKGAK